MMAPAKWIDYMVGQSQKCTWQMITGDAAIKHCEDQNNYVVMGATIIYCCSC
jgi:hypothetical protein